LKKAEGGKWKTVNNFGKHRGRRNCYRQGGLCNHDEQSGPGTDRVFVL